MKSWSRWMLAFGLVLAVILFYALSLQDYFTWDHIRTSLDRWQQAVRANLLFALAIYFVLYVAIAALSLPVAGIVTLVGGALFGRWLGTAVVSLASTAGAVLAFLSCRFVLREWVASLLGDRLNSLQRGLERDGAYYLLTLRLVPIFPFFLINLGMGLTRISVATFAGVSMIGMLPGTFLYVFAGEALATVDSPRGLLSPNVLIALTLLGVLPLVLRKLVRVSK